MTFLEKLVEGYEKNGMIVTVADAPDWMNSVDKLVIVKKVDSSLIFILHCYNCNTGTIVATF